MAAPSSGYFIAGCDPGKTGAVAVVTVEGAFVEGWLMPVYGTGGGVDPEALAARFYDMSGMRRVYIEDVRAMPNDGRSSAFSFGYSTGILVGVTVGMGFSVVRVRPQEWHKEIFRGKAKIYKVDRRTGRRMVDKAKVVEIAKQMFPKLPVKRKADHGIAEAALIAEYGRRQIVGVET